jgi:hypothetical protein
MDHYGKLNDSRRSASRRSEYRTNFDALMKAATTHQPELAATFCAVAPAPTEEVQQSLCQS